MKKLFFFGLVITVSLIIGVQNVSAHLIGQPPFFKINGVYSGYYPVSGTSIDNFVLPQDIAPDNYVINETIHFDLEKNQLPVPQEIVEQTKFLWDYGDGTKAQGFINDHVYTKPGSYILTVSVDTSSFQKGVAPQLLQSVLLNIVQNKDYTLPKSVISVNKKTVADPIGEWIVSKPGENLTFDGSTSFSASTIMSYFWDFGDGTSGNGKTVSHKYKDQVLIFPVLRIKTADGFIADSFVEIHNGNVTDSQVTPGSNIGTQPPQNDTEQAQVETGSKTTKTLAIISIIVVIGIASFIYLSKTNKR